MPEITGHEPDRARVAQVRVEHDHGDRHGSGYRVSDIVVLTAARVVEGASSVEVVFNADRSDRWSTTANVALCEPTADVAILELDWADGLEPVAPAQFGYLDRLRAEVPCRAIGSPLMRSNSGRYRGARQADGVVRSRTHQGEDLVEFTVTRPRGGTHPDASPWDGMSGAAMWCADQIVGVVSSPLSHDPNRLAAADVTSWYKRLDADRLVELTGILRLPGQIDQVEPIAAAAAKYRAVPAAGPGVLDAAYENAIAESFVEPPGWDTAVGVLRRSRILLLRATPGSGRRTAAIRLLGVSEQRSEPIHELDHQRDEPDFPLFDSGDIAAGDRYLLDLSAVGGEQLVGILHQLVPFARAVAGWIAKLVVVVPAVDDDVIPTELRPGLVELGRPDGGSVFQEQLAAHGVSEHTDPPPPQLQAILDHGSMAAITDLARTVRAAQDHLHAWSLTDLIGQALAARSERAEQVATRVAQRADGNFRSLLLASAVFEGHPADEVLDAQQSLLRILDTGAETKHEFEQAGLAHRFRAIDAEVDGNSAIQFPLLDYAEAVRRHFWGNHPGLGDKLREWVAERGSQMDWPRAVGDEFVRRFADACLSAQRPGDLVAVIEDWAFGNSAQVALATSALAYGLGDPRSDWWFRRQCYRWASARTLRPQIAGLVIPACATRIAPNHPTAAIVRLHHLSKNYDNGVAEFARSALISLADEPRIFRRLLARLANPPRARLDIRAERDLFLAVAHPDRIGTLIAEHAVRSRLVTGWDAVFEHSGETEYVGHVYRWLDAHAVDDRFLDVLIEACGNGFSRAVTLRTMGDRWSRTTTSDGDAVMDELEQRLNTFRWQL